MFYELIEIFVCFVVLYDCLLRKLMDLYVKFCYISVQSYVTLG